ncbi:Aminoglycoside phosphotransferase [Candidatus Terasakiella magnetica]|uniref:Aminoglycoside phosphotransferase n=1 Tax=Candidatus Terasakiella magnetica TaxID=1867952 RepID=A0A1C3REA3_9PROT|nr:phosphotransferase [Candidatus Terasakiella magnetica]SCA55599.1 Aminoglycoside phosphotransferase [Candidatus Terasakiella magnetica]
MVDRIELRDGFLKENGWGDVDCPLLAGDASFRKYYRLSRGGKCVVLMDAPPPQEDVRPFIKIAKFLTGHGFSAPEIYAQDVENGFLLIEDLGDDTYTQLLAQGADEEALYQLATDVLIELHQEKIGLADDLPAYDVALLNRECLLLPQWWMQAAFDEDYVSEGMTASYLAAWKPAFEFVQKQPNVLVLRDYHVDNLLVLKGREGWKTCGLLDFQDAVAGSALYDLMSLLEDARRDIEPALIEKMKQRYLAAFKEMEREEFEAVFAILGAQRHAKVIGIFARLCMRDGKPIYLEHIPRVWRLFERSLEHPILKDVKEWVDTHIAQEKRGTPPCLMQ